MTDSAEDDSLIASMRAGQPGEGLAIGVVGGGAVGITVAADLAAAGADVTLVERETVGGSRRGDTASLRAAGVVYDAYATETDARLAGRSITRFESLASTSDRFGFRRCPYVIAVGSGDADRADALRTAGDRMRQSTRRVETVPGRRLGERFPALRTEDIGVALVAENAGWTEPAAYVDAMAARARTNTVTILEGTEASVTTGPPTITTNGTPRRFDSVLVAAGAHTRQICEAAGQSVPIKPYRVQALIGDEPYHGPMCFDATSGFYFRPHPDGVLLGDGTEPCAVDPDQWDRDADEWFRQDVSAKFDSRTGLDIGVVDSWAGLCTATPDGNPLVGELATDLYVATGWQGHGFMRAPAVAERVAGCMLGISEAPDSFLPTRFDGTESFEVREGMAIESR